MSEDLEKQERLETVLTTNKEKLSKDLPRGYLSVSQINQALRCWKQYEFRVIHNLVLPPSVALGEGKSIHHALEVAHTEAAKTETVPVDIMLDAFADAWREASKEIDWTTDEEGIGPNGVESRGQQLIRIYHTKQLPKIKTVVQDNKPQVEFPFILEISGIPIVGVIDLIGEMDSKPKIIDHKVVARKKTKDDIAKDIQLMVYSIYTKIKHGGFNCLVKTKNDIELVEDEIPQDMKWLSNIVTDVAATIKTGVFPRTHPSNWWCSPRFCGYYDICRRGL